jgi:hypothetical protein
VSTADTRTGRPREPAANGPKGRPADGISATEECVTSYSRIPSCVSSRRTTRRAAQSVASSGATRQRPPSATISGSGAATRRTTVRLAEAKAARPLAAACPGR